MHWMRWLLFAVIHAACTVGLHAQKLEERHRDWQLAFVRGEASWAPRLFEDLYDQGGLREGRLILASLALDPEENPLRARQVREELIAFLRARPARRGLEAAFADRLKAGFTESARVHREPVLAGRIVRVLLVWNVKRWRPQAERCLAVEHDELRVTSAEALAERSGHRSIPAIVDAIGSSSDAGITRRLVEALRRIVEGAAPGDDAAAAGRGDDRAAGTGSDRKAGAVTPGKRGAASIDPKVQREACRRLIAALHDPSKAWPPRVEIVRAFAFLRDASVIPVLIKELGKTQARLESGSRVPTGLAFYASALHERLVDLTGFWAPASQPVAWQEFWQRENRDFVVRPSKKSDSKTRAGFFGIPVRGRRVLFVLDVSASMKKPHVAGETRLARAKRELLAALAKLDPAARFRVMVFSDDTREFRRAFERAAPGRLAELRRWLDRIRPDGHTHLSEALSRGMKGKIHREQSKTRPSIDEIFVLSDGQPSSDPTMLLERVRRWNPGRVARIHSVYLGTGGPRDHEGLPKSLTPYRFMDRLAGDNGGTFRPARSIKESR